MNRDEWIAAFAAELGVEPPSSEEVERLLALAGEAAHASERTAAPISCWIASRAPMDAEHALAIARRLAAAHDAD